MSQKWTELNNFHTDIFSIISPILTKENRIVRLFLVMVCVPVCSEIRDQTARRRGVQRSLSLPWKQEDQHHRHKQVHTRPDPSSSSIGLTVLSLGSLAQCAGTLLYFGVLLLFPIFSAKQIPNQLFYNLYNALFFIYLIIYNINWY